MQSLNDDYERLEKILQNHEAEIRVHIRVSTNIRVYCSSRVSDSYLYMFILYPPTLSL